jgi:hypothetical protein
MRGLGAASLWNPSARLGSLSPYPHSCDPPLRIFQLNVGFFVSPALSCPSKGVKALQDLVRWKDEPPAGNRQGVSFSRLKLASGSLILLGRHRRYQILS